MSDRDAFRANRDAGLRARHETRLSRAIRREVAEEIAQAIERKRDAPWGLFHAASIGPKDVLSMAAAWAREIGSKEAK